MLRLSLSRTIGHLAVGTALLLGAANAQAETFPNKPVHILVPYAAGGAVDVLARTLGQSLAKIWGQQPVIDNRPGAGGVIASQALATSAPDGYTLILVASGHPLNQFIYPSLPYDTFKDFTAITEIASSPLAIVASKTSPYANLGDVLVAARKEPDSLSYGMSGNGTSAHLAGELLKYMAGVKIVAVPYKGGSPALTAVMSVWWGFLGPAHMAPDVVAKLQTDLKAALQDQNVLTTLGKIGATPVGTTASEFDAFMHAEVAKWEPVLKAANIRAQ